MLQSSTPKGLWDNGLELETYVRFNAACELDVEVPKAVMSGEASEISQLYKLEWFE